MRTVRVAAIQATPVMLDAEACVAKAIRLIEDAAGQGAELAVLPETFVPLYPSNRWAKGAAAFGGWDELWERLHANAVDVPGPLVDRLVAGGPGPPLSPAPLGNGRGGGPPPNTPPLPRAQGPSPPPSTGTPTTGRPVPP